VDQQTLAMATVTTRKGLRLREGVDVALDHVAVTRTVLARAARLAVNRRGVTTMPSRLPPDRWRGNTNRSSLYLAGLEGTPG
jgi:hypothetical protein